MDNEIKQLGIMGVVVSIAKDAPLNLKRWYCFEYEHNLLF